MRMRTWRGCDELCLSLALLCSLKAAELGQEERDNLGRRLLQLTLQELFVYRFMQTDPNWGNFLYDKRRDRVALLDFGAAREFSEKFVDNYLRIVRGIFFWFASVEPCTVYQRLPAQVWAAANDDRDTFHSVSKDMGILTGYENEDMVKVCTVGACCCRSVGGITKRCTPLRYRPTLTRASSSASRLPRMSRLTLRQLIFRGVCRSTRPCLPSTVSHLLRRKSTPCTVACLGRSSCAFT